jgi:SAM-dependent methyltransferase
VTTGATKKVISMNEHEGVGLEQDIYSRRFSAQEEKVRNETWDVLIAEFFQDLIPRDARVLDLGAGDGMFVKRITADKKIAVDLSPHVHELEKHGITVIQAPATDFVSQLSEPVDVIFMSNFLEHLPDKRTLLAVLSECRDALVPGGRVLILQPNIRYVGVKYWDYIDHHIALTEHSLAEALEVSDFTVKKLIPRFLPYTSKSGVGRLSTMFSTRSVVSMYLKYPVLWRIFGAQTFVEAVRK